MLLKNNNTKYQKLAKELRQIGNGYNYASNKSKRLLDFDQVIAKYVDWFSWQDFKERVLTLPEFDRSLWVEKILNRYNWNALGEHIQIDSIKEGK